MFIDYSQTSNLKPKYNQNLLFSKTEKDRQTGSQTCQTRKCYHVEQKVCLLSAGQINT